MEHISIKHFCSADISMVLDFYKRTTYKSADSTVPEDEIVVAYSTNEIIGLYRLCHEADVCVLRGFYILEEYRGRGVGSRMLQVLDAVATDKDVYLICTKPRNSFYAKAGFVVADANVPKMLLDRKNKYNNPEMNILLRPAENVD